MVLQSAKSLIDRVRSEAHVHLPRGLRRRRPVVQIAIHDGDIRTAITLVHFPSFFAPTVASEYRYEVSLLDAAGEPVGSRSFHLGHLESRQVELSVDLGVTPPPLGLVVVELKAVNPLFSGDVQLGDLTPHFFTRYSSTQGGGSALIHPQSRLEASPAPGLHWESNAFIEAERMSRLQVFQMNPSREAAESSVFLRDVRSNEVVWRSAATLPAGGTRAMTVGAETLHGRGLLRLGAEGLGAENAKPLLFCRLRDGTMFGMHS